MRPIPRRLFLVVLALLAATGTAPAQTVVEPRDLPTSVREAQLIFVGTVREINFRDSNVGGDDFPSIPHTFVTYAIETVVKGAYSDSTLTLRFLGGYSPASGQVLVAPGGRLFRAGDRDILIVSGNGRAACPLVGCTAGRFRVVDGHVYGNAGLAVRLVDDDLRTGPDALPAERLEMIVPPAPTARLEALRLQLADPSLSAEARAGIEARLATLSVARSLGLARPGRTPGEIPTTPPATEAELLELLRRLAPSPPGGDYSVASADPDAPFQVRMAVPQRVERTGRPAAPPRAPTEEQRLLHANGGNPVISGGQP